MRKKLVLDTKLRRHNKELIKTVLELHDLFITTRDQGVLLKMLCEKQDEIISSNTQTMQTAMQVQKELKEYPSLKMYNYNKKGRLYRFLYKIEEEKD